MPVPGTVHLVDLEGTMKAAHAKGAGKKDIVLVPAPSSDPDDPVSLSPQTYTNYFVHVLTTSN